MTEFLDLTLSGLSLGCIYALIAIGFVLVFKATGVVNFAHGSILLLGAYVAARVQADVGFWPALLDRRGRRGGGRRARRRRADAPAARRREAARWRSSRSASTSCSPPS